MNKMISSGYVDIDGRPIFIVEDADDERGFCLMALDGNGDRIYPDEIFPPERYVEIAINRMSDALVKAINDFVVPSDGTEDAIDRLREDLARVITKGKK